MSILLKSNVLYGLQQTPLVVEPVTLATFSFCYCGIDLRIWPLLRQKACDVYG